jgi:hypothetical protein
MNRVSVMGALDPRDGALGEPGVGLVKSRRASAGHRGAQKPETMQARRGQPMIPPQQMAMRQQQQQQQQMAMRQQGRQMPAQGRASSDSFLSKLGVAEDKDALAQQGVAVPSSRGGEEKINQWNWTERSKNIGRLHIQNELAELSYKERVGLLPQPSPEQQMQMQQQQLQQQRHQQMQGQRMPGGPTPSQQMQGRQMTPQQMQQQRFGGAPAQQMQGRQMQQQQQQQFNPYGGKQGMSAQQGAAVRRGNASSIVFG